MDKQGSSSHDRMAALGFRNPDFGINHDET